MVVVFCTPEWVKSTQRMFIHHLQASSKTCQYMRLSLFHLFRLMLPLHFCLRTSWYNHSLKIFCVVYDSILTFIWIRCLKITRVLYTKHSDISANLQYKLWKLFWHEIFLWDKLIWHEVMIYLFFIWCSN